MFWCKKKEEQKPVEPEKKFKWVNKKVNVGSIVITYTFRDGSTFDSKVYGYAYYDTYLYKNLSDVPYYLVKRKARLEALEKLQSLGTITVVDDLFNPKVSRRGDAIKAEAGEEEFYEIEVNTPVEITDG